MIEFTKEWADEELAKTEKMLSSLGIEMEILDPIPMSKAFPPPSPFLPGTKLQYAWDSTSLGYLKQCPRLYYYIMIEGWQSADESIHLRFGNEFHQALQEYENSRANGVRHEDAIHDCIAALMERTADWHVDLDTKAGKYKNRVSLCQLVVDYLDYYGPLDKAETYIKQDGQPAVELSFKFELNYGPQIAEANDKSELEITGEAQPYLLCGHLDRVVSFNDALMVMDRKTTTTTPGPYFFDQFEPNNQMTLYTIAGKVVLNAPIKGVIIDAAQVLLEEPNRFVRGFTYRTQDQLDEWLSDLSTMLRINEVYAQAGHWPQNDTACDKYGGCRFRKVCSKSPAVRERFLKADFVQLPEEERWNPLKPR